MEGINTVQLENQNPGVEEMARKLSLFVLIIFTALIFTGCWNNRDLTELSILTALGIDKKDDGKIEVTAQIIKPTEVGTSGAGGGSGGGGDKKGFVVVSNTDRTIFAALRGMLGKVNKKIFYSSSQVIVIGEELAKSGIQDYIDFILRDQETQYKSLILIAKGSTAKEIVEQEYELSKVPGAFIRDTLKNTVSRGFTKKMNLLGMARELATEGRELSIATIEKQENTTLTEGMAVFRRDRMIGWLDKFETRGYSIITNRAKSSIIEIPSDKSGKVIGIELTKVSSKIKTEVNKDKELLISIKIKVKGNIGEEQETGSKNTNELCDCVEKNLKKQILKECENTIKKSQREFKSDIFGFGMHVFDAYPDYWKTVSEKWSEEIYPNVKVKLSVEAEIQRTGLISKNIKIE